MRNHYVIVDLIRNQAEQENCRRNWSWRRYSIWRVSAMPKRKT